MTIKNERYDIADPEVKTPKQREQLIFKDIYTGCYDYIADSTFRAADESIHLKQQ